jgi:hypothetical protein
VLAVVSGGVTVHSASERRCSPTLSSPSEPPTEMLVVDSDVHLLFNEDLDRLLPPLLDRLARLASPTRPA